MRERGPRRRGSPLSRESRVRRKALGGRIKVLRKDKKLSQNELAAPIGARCQLLNKYESGRVTPPAEMLVRLADALGTSVDYLLTGSPVDDTQLASSRLSRRFQALEGLAEGDREAIIQVIDAMVVKHRTSAARH
ncbi:MAG TPA: helix-turn-helix transcriptional regulator [Acetobacteraceae bacterium]|nr:helix-turn-helix transcriptional regulator [Acetobacteraceae bacterium]